jgi:type III pantothenate kinase
MRPDIVVDVGNTRVKWGRCTDQAVVASAGLPHADAGAWQGQLDEWDLRRPLQWVVSGVHPATRDRLIDWARRRGDEVYHLERAAQLPLEVRLEHPDWAGIDRLLNAVAVNRRRQKSQPALAVDAGSAVTVDYIDAGGAFCGGAIFPGLRLMAQALHDHTALLPLIQIQSPEPPVPGPSTMAAMEAGVYWTVVGGIQALVRRFQLQAGPGLEVYLAGGDGPLLQPALEETVVAWPNMTLEGLRLAAEALP